MSLYQKLEGNFCGDGRHLLAFDREGYDIILKEIDRLRLHFEERAERYAGDIARKQQTARFNCLEAIAIVLSEKLRYNDNGSICFPFNEVFSRTNEICRSSEQKGFQPSSIRDKIKNIFDRIDGESGFRGGSEKPAAPYKITYKIISGIEYGYITSSARIR